MFETEVLRAKNASDKYKPRLSTSKSLFNSFGNLILNRFEQNAKILWIAQAVAILSSENK